MTEYPYIYGYVWLCGDEFCDCSMATIERIGLGKTLPSGRRLIDRETLWEGSFHTDGEPGAVDDLTEMRSAIEAFHPEVVVAWQS